MGAGLRLIVVATVLTALVACSRGPVPPAPTEALEPSVIGVIAETVTEPPVLLVDEGAFSPPEDVRVDRLRNWPASDGNEPEALISGLLLLGGERADGSWWYELAGFAGPNEDGCWPIHGGSFDLGHAVHLSSGVLLPKAPGFEIRDGGHNDVDWFPGHQDDSICVDDQGRAVYFEAFIGR